MDDQFIELGKLYYEVLNKDKLIKYIDILIFQDKNMRENTLKDIHIRLTNILNYHRFQSRINTANNNWLEIPIKDVTDSVLDYFDGLVLNSGENTYKWLVKPLLIIFKNRNPYIY